MNYDNNNGYLCDHCNKKLEDEWQHSICDENIGRFDNLCHDCFKEEFNIVSDEFPWCGHRYFRYKHSFQDRCYDDINDISRNCKGMECPDEICKCGDKNKVLEYLQNLDKEETLELQESARKSSDAYDRAETHYWNVLSNLTSYGKVSLK